ncbi:hypothetical protein TruAng_010125 [Truncatella angustata]|nr:hypothetical protein TruAng_010125 [Truncatella angustata]
MSALQSSGQWEEVIVRLRNGQTVESISEWLGGALSAGSGSGTLHSFAQRPGPSNARGPGPGLTLPPLSGIADFGFGSTSTHTTNTNTTAATALPGGYGSFSFGPQHSQKHEFDHQSPWAFSSHSQTQSTRSNSHPDVMQWTSDVPPINRVGTWVQDQASTDELRYKGTGQILAPLDSPDTKSSPTTTWTGITGDTALVQHLLALYFCWEYPTFASLSKEHFLKDFLDGRARYCSPILINALLALGCRFSSQPSTRANPDDPTTSGDHFFKEALRLLAKESNHHTLTTIQALGIMSIREASCGRDSESWYYAGQSVRMAIEMGLHRLNGDGDSDEMAVQAATFWGAFALDHAWSLATGSLPQCSCFPHLPPKPAIIDDIEASLWVPYTDSEYLNWYDQIPEVLRLGTNFTPAVLFAHMYYHFAILLLFRPLIKLRIIGSSIRPRDVCAQAADAIQGLCKSYSQLYTLRRTPSFVPYFVLTAAIMQLALGAVHTPIQDTMPDTSSSGSTAKPESGDASHTHPRPSSSSTAGPRSPLSTSTTKVNPRGVDAINQGIADLTEMAPCHNFAEQALHILRYMAKKWNVPVNIPQSRGLSSNGDMNDLVRPQTHSLNFFVPNLAEEDFMCTWGTGTKGATSSLSEGLPGSEAQADADGQAMGPNKMRGPSSTGKQSRIEEELGAGPMAHAVKSIENPLFWPFPMQGRPMVPSGGRMLEEAGFALL